MDKKSNSMEIVMEKKLCSVSLFYFLSVSQCVSVCHLSIFDICHKVLLEV